MKKQRKSKNIKATETESKPKSGIYIILLIIIVALSFFKSSQFDFVDIDDERLIYENPLVTDASIPYSACFVKFIKNVHYKPLVFLTWKAEYQLFGSDASHFHTINWLLHLLNSILLFFIGTYLFRKLFTDEKLVFVYSFALALFFAINPLRIESVVWATERKDVLFGFFFLLAWLMYIFYTEKKQYKFLILSAVFYLLSGLSKSVGLTLVAVVFLMDYWNGSKINAKLIWEKIPYFVVFVFLLGVYGLLSIKSNSAATLNPTLAANDLVNSETTSTLLASMSPLPRWIISASVRFVLWIAHLLIPIKLSVLYPHNEIYTFLGKSIYIFPVIALGMLVFAGLKRKKYKVLWISVLYFVITISPALLLQNTGIFVFLSDRYTYIASVGIGLFIIGVLYYLKLNRTSVYAIIAGIGIFYFTATQSNIDAWKNSENLFTHALKVNPNAEILYLNLGQYYLGRNNPDKSFDIYTQGIELEIPGSHKLYSNRGGIYLNHRQFDLALKDYNKCLSMDSNYVSALVNRGLVYSKKMNLNNALSDLNRALKISPSHTEALSNRAMLNFQFKNYNEAIDDFEKVVLKKTNDDNAYNFMGLCYNQLSEFEQAIIQFTKAIEIAPNNAAYFMYRSYAFNSLGNKINAMSDAKKAQQLGFNVSQAYINSLS